MSPAKQTATDAAADLAGRLTEALQRERIVPRFVDSYVVEHGRHGLQVHAALYRDLLTLLQREALIAASVRAMEIITNDFQPTTKSKPRPMAKKDATEFRRKYLGALARHQKWTAGDALDFQRVGGDAGKDGERQSALPGSVGHALAEVTSRRTH